MQLRPYQTTLHLAILAAWNTGYRNVLAVLPTGGGKTVTFAHIIRENIGASIVLAHRAELVAQISVALAREGVRHRIIGPSKLARLCVKAHLKEIGQSYYDPNAPTGVGSVQSIATAAKKYGEWFQQITLWVHDEAHHITKENQFGRAIKFFPNARGLGVTATPMRADGQGLGDHADGVMHILIPGPCGRDLISAGWLSDYKIFAPPSTLDLSNVHVTDSGDYSPKELKIATQQSSVIGDIIAHYCKHAPGKQGLTFSDSIENASDIATRFRAAGVRAEVLTGKTPDDLRANIIEQFKSKVIQQIVSVALIDEGFDCPGIEVVSDGAATESFGRFAQRFGRGLRPLPGKNFMIYFDHVGNVKRHGLPDAYRVHSLDRRERRDMSKSDAIPTRICANDNVGGAGTVCGKTFERFLKLCPYCGFKPELAARNAPEFVDGDLEELDAATLADMRAEIERIDAPAVLPFGAGDIARLSAYKRHGERQEAQAKLRNALEWFGGAELAQGHTIAEGHKRFYFKFGLDIGSAQALGSREALELAEKLIIELNRFGIDGTVNAGAYLANA